MSVTKKKKLDWYWSYEFDKKGISIEYSGVDETGTMLDATPEGKPYQLDRQNEGTYFRNGKKLLFNHSFQIVF